MAECQTPRPEEIRFSDGQQTGYSWVVLVDTMPEVAPLRDGAHVCKCGLLGSQLFFVRRSVWIVVFEKAAEVPGQRRVNLVEFRRNLGQEPHIRRTIKQCGDFVDPES